MKTAFGSEPELDSLAACLLHEVDTLAAWLLLSSRVPRDTEQPSEADRILLDAMEHLMRSIGR